MLIMNVTRENLHGIQDFRAGRVCISKYFGLLAMKRVICSIEGLKKIFIGLFISSNQIIPGV